MTKICALPDATHTPAFEFRCPYIKAVENRGLPYRSEHFLAPLIAEVAAAEGHERPPSVRQLGQWLELGAEKDRAHVEQPLERVEFETALLDVFVPAASRDKPSRRPWLTVALDRYTRAVLGVLVTHHPPSERAAVRCLHNVISPKEDLLSTYPGIRGRWPCYGIPTAVVTDGGPEYCSRRLVEACKQLNIALIERPTRSPRYVSRGERFLNRLRRQMVQKIPEKERALMSLAELQGNILKWIVDDYMQSIHRGINDTPLRKWEEAVKRHPVSMPVHAEEVGMLLQSRFRS